MPLTEEGPQGCLLFVGRSEGEVPALTGDDTPAVTLWQNDGHAQAGAGTDYQARCGDIWVAGLQAGQLRSGCGHGTQRGGGEVIGQVQGGQAEALRQFFDVDVPWQVGQSCRATIVGHRAGHGETAAAYHCRVGLRVGKESGEDLAEPLEVGVGVAAICNLFPVPGQAEQRLGAAYVSDKNHTATGAEM
jgi:hypothetical protein